MVEILFALKAIAIGVGVFALFGAVVVVYTLAKASSIEDERRDRRDR